ncbi:MAG: hypothetical protein GMKNLPBB_02722 [Myxococcota bacterium]|nr:hypothetical protein [Myxococcota bacterium]
MKKWDADSAREHLLDYVYGELEDSDRRSYETYLLTDAALREEARKFRTVGVLESGGGVSRGAGAPGGGGEEFTISRATDEAVLRAAINHAPHPESRVAWWRLPAFLLRPQVAMAFVFLLVGAVSLVLYKSNELGLGRMTAPEIGPIEPILPEDVPEAVRDKFQVQRKSADAPASANKDFAGEKTELRQDSIAAAPSPPRTMPAVPPAGVEAAKAKKAEPEPDMEAADNRRGVSPGPASDRDDARVLGGAAATGGKGGGAASIEGSGGEIIGSDSLAGNAVLGRTSKITAAEAPAAAAAPSPAPPVPSPAAGSLADDKPAGPPAFALEKKLAERPNAKDDVLAGLQDSARSAPPPADKALREEQESSPARRMRKEAMEADGDETGESAAGAGSADEAPRPRPASPAYFEEMNRGRAAFASGHYEEALEAFLGAQRTLPPKAEAAQAVLYISLTQARLNKCNYSMLYLMKMRQLDPQTPGAGLAYIELGDCNARNGSTAAAISLYQDAIRFYPAQRAMAEQRIRALQPAPAVQAAPPAAPPVAAPAKPATAKPPAEERPPAATGSPGK